MMFYQSRRNGMGGLGCLIFAIVGLVALYYILRWSFILLLYASPILFILAVLIKPKVVRDAYHWLVRAYQKDVLTGVVYTFLGIVGFPIVALSLFMNAVRERPISLTTPEEKDAAADEYVDFEELDSEPLEPTKPAEKLPKQEDQPKEKGKDNPYEDLFS